MTTIAAMGKELEAGVAFSWRENMFTRMSIAIDEDRIALRTKGLLSERVTHFHVMAVDHKFDTVRRISWGGLVGFLAFGLPGVLVWLVALRVPEMKDALFSAFWGSVFLLIAAVCGWQAKKNTGTFHCLFSNYQAQPLLLIRHCPATEAGLQKLRVFLKEKQRVIRDENTAADSLAGQLRQLGELHKSGVLNAAEFASAKEKIIGRNAAIGFARKDS